MIIPAPRLCRRGDPVKFPEFDRPEDIPGQERVQLRRFAASKPLALLAAVCWPPLVLTLFIWPPKNWMPGLDTDWRLTLLVIGLITVPLGLWRFLQGRAVSARPITRAGIIWRFMLYGGLLAAGLQVLIALVTLVLGGLEAGSFLQGLGAAETTLLIYGVGGLPIAILVGVSYAVWAGLCVAFIAFEKSPDVVNDRLGLMERR